MKLEDKVQEYVEQNGTTRDELATKAGMKRRSFYYKLSGESEFSLEESYKLSRILGISVDEFYELAKS